VSHAHILGSKATRKVLNPADFIGQDSFMPLTSMSTFSFNHPSISIVTSVSTRE